MSEPRLAARLPSTPAARLSGPRWRLCRAVFHALLVCCATSCGRSEPNEFAKRKQAIFTMILEGQYASAERDARALVTSVEVQHGDSSAVVAEALDVLAESLWYSKLRREPSSIAVAERAVELKEAFFGPTDARLVTSLTNLAVLLEVTDQSRARTVHERAVSIATSALPPNDPALGRALLHHGGFLAEGDEYARANEALYRALRIFEATSGELSDEASRTLNKLGVSAWRQSDFNRARQHWERMLEVREALWGTNSSSAAGALNNLAAVDVVTGDYEQALARYNRALSIRIATIDDPNHSRIVGTMSNKAEMEFMLGRYDESRQTYERAMAIARRNGDVQLLSQCLHGLGRIHQELGQHDQAEEALTEALTLRLGNEDLRRVARTQHYLAENAYHVGSIDSARARCRRALDARVASLGREHPETAESMWLLAAILAEWGDVHRAVETAQGAETLAAAHVRLTSRALAERQALLYAGVRTRGLDVMLQAAVDRRELSDDERVRIWDTLAGSRALVLDEMATRSRAIAQSGDPRVAELHVALQEASSHLAKLMLRGPDDDPSAYESNMREARDAQERAARMLAERSESFRAELKRDAVHYADIVQHLPPTTALVAYAVYDRHERVLLGSRESRGTLRVVPGLMAFVQPVGRTIPAAVDLGRMSTVDSLVQRWRREAAFGVATRRTPEQSAAAYLQEGAALRQRIWDPIAPLLAGAEQVFIVPAGSVNLVNFAALPLALDRFLVDEGRPLHYLAAERDLVTDVETRDNEGILVLGDPDFDASLIPRRLGCSSGAPPVATLRGAAGPCAGLPEIAQFPALPQTGVEARAVAEAWNHSETSTIQATVLLGAAATEAAFKSQSAGKRNLHLATHGFFLDSDCRPGIGYAPEVQLSVRRRGLGIANLLERSGLAFCGANQNGGRGTNGEDGILLAEEIADLDLQGVEWTVLSACDTGVGEVQVGEGILGLRRAFQVAGVQTLVMSLWSVSDDATRTWMQHLYENRLSRRLGTADAVQQASLEVLNERRSHNESAHPFYWASFVGAGNWN